LTEKSDVDQGDDKVPILRAECEVRSYDPKR